MRALPSFPLIEVYNDGLNIIEELGNLGYTSLHVLKAQKKANIQVFDSGGTCWTYFRQLEKESVSWWGRFKDFFTIQSTLPVKVHWQKTGTYTTRELQNLLIRLIDEDDDLLTQFIEHNDLKQKVIESSTFQAIFITLKKYIFEPDMDSIAHEFGYNEEEEN